MLRDAPTVSVLTIHHGPMRTLNRLKHALAAQTYPHAKFTWIVIDDASWEDPPEWYDTPDTPFAIEAHRLENNVGRARARNLALQLAKGEIIAFIDSDMEPVTVWLEMMVRAVLHTDGVIAGRYDPHPSLNPSAFLQYSHTRGAHKHHPGDRIPGRYFTSGNSAFPRHVLDIASEFDEGFEGWGGEDLEFAIRLENAGMFFYYEPRARSFHEHDITWTQQVQRYQAFSDHAIPRLLDRHPHLECQLSLNKLRIRPGRGLMAGVIRPWLLRNLCSEPVFEFINCLVTAFPRFPWPAKVFDYLVFQLYSRSYARNLQHGVHP